jgi:hypothetical protein
MQGLHPRAKDAFRRSNDLAAVVKRYYGRPADAGGGGDGDDDDAAPLLTRASSVGMSGASCVVSTAAAWSCAGSHPGDCCSCAALQ